MKWSLSEIRQILRQTTQFATLCFLQLVFVFWTRRLTLKRNRGDFQHSRERIQFVCSVLHMWSLKLIKANRAQSSKHHLVHRQQKAHFASREWLYWKFYECRSKSDSFKFCQDYFGSQLWACVGVEPMWFWLLASNLYQMTMQGLPQFNNTEEILWFGSNLLSHGPQIDSQMTASVKISLTLTRVS